jgi:hypothetical protein
MEANIDVKSPTTLLISFSNTPDSTVISAIKGLLNVTVLKSTNTSYLVSSNTVTLRVLLQKIVMTLAFQGVTCLCPNMGGFE